MQVTEIVNHAMPLLSAAVSGGAKVAEGVATRVLGDMVAERCAHAGRASVWLDFARDPKNDLDFRRFLEQVITQDPEFLARFSQAVQAAEAERPQGGNHQSIKISGSGEAQIGDRGDTIQGSRIATRGSRYHEGDVYNDGDRVINKKNSRAALFVIAGILIIIGMIKIVPAVFNAISAPGGSPNSGGAAVDTGSPAANGANNPADSSASASSPASANLAAELAATGTATDQVGDKVKISISIGQPKTLSSISDSTAQTCDSQVTASRAVAFPVTVAETVKSSIQTNVDVHLDNSWSVGTGGNLSLTNNEIFWAGIYNGSPACNMDTGSGTSVTWNSTPGWTGHWTAYLIVNDAVTPNDPTGVNQSAGLIILQPGVDLDNNIANYIYDIAASQNIVNCIAPTTGLSEPYVSVDAQLALAHGCTA